MEGLLSMGPTPSIFFRLAAAVVTRQVDNTYFDCLYLCFQLKCVKGKGVIVNLPLPIIWDLGQPPIVKIFLTSRAIQGPCESPLQDLDINPHSGLYCLV